MEKVCAFGVTNIGMSPITPVKKANNLRWSTHSSPDVERTYLYGSGWRTLSIYIRHINPIYIHIYFTQIHKNHIAYIHKSYKSYKSYMLIKLHPINHDRFCLLGTTARLQGFDLFHQSLQGLLDLLHIAVQRGLAHLEPCHASPKAAPVRGTNIAYKWQPEDRFDISRVQKGLQNEANVGQLKIPMHIINYIYMCVYTSSTN